MSNGIMFFSKMKSWSYRKYTWSHRAGEDADGITINTHHIRYSPREAKDAARRAFGPRCLNCADETHFAPE